ncbi:MAG: NepR family anti-sigma factor [Bauldia sp.]
MSDSASEKPKGEKPRRSGKADPLVATAIGQKLRTMYDGMLAEPVPSDLADLVRRLSGGSADGKTGS